MSTSPDISTEEIRKTYLIAKYEKAKADVKSITDAIEEIQQQISPLKGLQLNVRNSIIYNK